MSVIGIDHRRDFVGRLLSAYRVVTGVRLHIADRLFEWYAAAVMCLVAVLVSMPQTHLVGAFSTMIEWGFSRNILLLFFATFGSIRIFALIANGNLPHGGPVVRVFCATMAAPIWGLLSLALLRDWYYGGEISLGIAVYTPLMLGDMYAAKRATLDVGRR